MELGLVVGGVEVDGKEDERGGGLARLLRARMMISPRPPVGRGHAHLVIIVPV